MSNRIIESRIWKFKIENWKRGTKSTKWKLKKENREIKAVPLSTVSKKGGGFNCRWSVEIFVTFWQYTVIRLSKLAQWKFSLLARKFLPIRHDIMCGTRIRPTFRRFMLQICQHILLLWKSSVRHRKKYLSNVSMGTRNLFKTFEREKLN